MKQYIQPTVDLLNASMSLALMISTHDEVGEGQLSNGVLLDQFDESLSSPKPKSLWDEGNEEWAAGGYFFLTQQGADLWFCPLFDFE